MEANINYLLEQVSGPKQKLIIDLRDLIISTTSGITETVKWGRLTFVANEEPIAFICSNSAHSYVELGFFKGVLLSDANGLLHGKGPSVRRLRIDRVDTIPAAQIRRWIKESIHLHSQNTSKTRKEHE